MKTIIDLFHDRLQAQPEKVVYRFWQNGAITDKLSFSDLDRRARAVAAHLQTVAPAGERVLLLFPQSLDIIVGFFACSSSGLVATPVPLPFKGSIAERLLVLKRYLEDARAQTILTTSTVSSTLRSGAEEAGLEQVRWIDIEDVDMFAGADWKYPAITPDMPALLLYTSGSTQFPRGILASHANLAVALAAMFPPQKGIQPTTSVAWAPLHNVIGLMWSLQTLENDSTQLWLSPQSFIQKPITWLNLISDYHATSSIAATFAYRLCVEGIKPEERQGLDLSSWKMALVGGEPIRWDVMNQFARAYEPYGFSAKALTSAYGMSEALGGAQGEIGCGLQGVWANKEALEQNQLTEEAPEFADAKPLISCGKPFAGYRMVIVDPGTCQPCRPGQIGELWIAGSGIAQGYWNKPSETAETFAAHLANGEGPFLRTGDLGFFKNDELYITGRLKDVIILNGRNLLAIDIEAAAAGAHPVLLPGTAVAFGVTVDDEEKVVLMHEIRPGQDQVDLDEIAGKVRQAVSGKIGIPLYAVGLVKPGSLPRTGSGKIQRYLCRSRYLESLSE